MPIGRLETDLIRRHEGTGPRRRGRLLPYTDTVGKTTIGYGRNLTDRGISPDEAECLLGHDLEAAERDCQTFAWWDQLNRPRKAVLIDMMHNMGLGRVRRFRKMIRALQAEQYDTAAAELLDSKYARQVGKGPQQRAGRLAKMLKTGEWPKPRKPNARRASSSSSAG